MDQSTSEHADVSIAEERIRLEREALAVERERLAAARAHAEAEAQIARSRRTVPLAVMVTLLALLSFAGGILVGYEMNESRQRRQRESRLAQALSQLGPLAVPQQGGGTNGTDAVRSPARRDVAVVVIQ